MQVGQLEYSECPLVHKTNDLAGMSHIKESMAHCIRILFTSIPSVHNCFASVTKSCKKSLTFVGFFSPQYIPITNTFLYGFTDPNMGHNCFDDDFDNGRPSILMDILIMPSGTIDVCFTIDSTPFKAPEYSP